MEKYHGDFKMSDLVDMALCDKHYREILDLFGWVELPVLTIDPALGCRVCGEKASGYYEGLPLEDTVRVMRAVAELFDA